MGQRSHISPLLRQYARKQIVKNHSPVLDDQSQMSNRAPRYIYPDNNQSKDYLRKHQFEKQSQPCFDRRYNVDNIIPSPEHSPKGNYPSEMVRLLLEENSNLKEQNKYLHGKLRQISSKQTQLVETVLEYETIMAALNTQNQQLQKQVLYFSERANSRVDKLGKKLGKLLNKNQNVRHKERQQNIRDLEESQSNIDRGERQKQRYIDSRDSAPYLIQPQPNPFKRIKSQQRMNENKFVDQSAYEVENINNQFEALLYACRMEVNPEKRKELRRRLVSLTYKKNPLSP